MRILVLNHEYPPIGGGGGKVCQEIAHELASRGHELVILTSHFKGLPRKESSKNQEIIRLPAARTRMFQAGLFTMGLFIFQSVREGLRIIHKWKPEMIHVHFAVPAGAAAYILNRLTGVPYVLTAHLGDIPGGSPQKTEKMFRIIYPFTKLIWRKASKITTVSAYTASLIHQQYGLTAQVIPNGISARESSVIVSHTPPIILFVGRFVIQKNLGVFLDVLESIRDLSWRCTMVGDGPLRKQVISRIDRSGLSERFFLPGWVEPNRVLKLMDQSDILFMPSLSEGFPVVGLQALDAGLAIVASNVGGFIDLVKPGKNGMLISPMDKISMQNGLADLLSNQQKLLLFRKNSRELVDQFDVKNLASQYELFFLDLATIKQPRIQ